MSLVNRVLKGTLWAYASLFSSRLIVFLANAWLVRLLSQEEFGLRHMALIVISLFEMLQSLGVNEALIYESDEVEKATENVFLINLGLGALFSVITISFGLWIVPNMSTAGILSQLLGESNLTEIKAALSLLPVLGTNFFISSLGQTHETLLRKNLDFKTKFWPDIISAIIRSAVAIGMALAGFGVMSLVYSYIVGSIVRTISNWIIVPYRPKFRYYPEVAASIWRYGGGLTVFKILGSFFDKVDEVVIGGGLGASSLGLYGEAQRIPDLLIMNLNVVLTRVLFPAYSGIKNEMDKLKASYLVATRYMTLLVTPIALGIFLVAPDFVALYFGPDWVLAIPLLQWLSLTMLWLTAAWNVGDVLKAIGRPGLLTRLLLIEAAINTPLLIFGAVLDARGVTSSPALGATIGSSIGFLFGSVIRLVLAKRLLDLTFREVLDLFVEPLIAGSVMFLDVYSLRWLLADWKPLPLLVVSTLVGAVAYLGVLWLIAKPTLLAGWYAIDSFVRSNKAKRVGETQSAELQVNE
jgi:lipopolysaccharide exporter